MTPDADETCLVLIDYDNAFPPNRGMSEDEIAVEVARWLQELASRHVRLTHFEVRLYGGWYDERDLSRHGSDVARVMAKLPDFPMVLRGGRIVRGAITLAAHPISSTSGGPLYGTYRRRGGPPRIRSRQPYPDACVQTDTSCPAAILRSFTKSARRECPVNTCSTIASEAFEVHEQKMVDTLLSTDILVAGRAQSGYSMIVVVSGDSDFLPPLMAASIDSDVALVQLLPRAEEASAYAIAVLSEVGVEILEMSS
ncbi:hypothetical protein [Microbacterium sp. CIAB417]|uniref:hypothetical protein n=1 Tax=Microbacterium sp. CIAB417 TaxID=2860287 RepID=UPI001FAB7ED6|nr:hypothetical protein [Microbacterium sp. CIAB417]